jgi:glycerol-3-phosphate acyltransferase PlsY
MFLPALWVVVSFISGSLPFSVWLGRLALKTDITQTGDRNPGATNVLRSGNFLWFSLALALDISKAAAPIGLAWFVFGWRDGWIVPIGIAPVYGHAFSPFLGGRGGKALAATFGSWVGLSLWQFSLPGLGALIVWWAVWRNDGWAVVCAMLTRLAFLLIWSAPGAFLAVWLGQFLLLVWKQRDDLRRRPALRFVK